MGDCLRSFIACYNRDIFKNIRSDSSKNIFLQGNKQFINPQNTDKLCRGTILFAKSELEAQLYENLKAKAMRNQLGVKCK